MCAFSFFFQTIGPLDGEGYVRIGGGGGTTLVKGEAENGWAFNAGEGIMNVVCR